MQEDLFDDIIGGEDDPHYTQDPFSPEDNQGSALGSSSLLNKTNPSDPEEDDEDEDFDEDINEDPDEDPNEDPENPNEDPNDIVDDSLEESDIINDLLLAKGIKDPKAILYETDSGETETVDFYSLSYDEQMAILKSDDSQINYGLSDDEISTLNFLRQNGVSFNETIEYFKQEAIREYQESLADPSLQIDSYSDEELYVLDLKMKYEDVTEEQALKALNLALQDPDLFALQTKRLRDEYKEVEMRNKEARDFERLSKEKEEHEQMLETLNTVAVHTEDIGGLDLADADKEDVMRYLLEQDINGKSEFDKLKQNPELLFKAAWFAVKGDEAFDILHSYYKNEIDKVRKNSYQKAKDDFEKNARPKAAPAEKTPRKRTVIKKSSPNGTPNTPGFRGYTTNESVGNIDDLYDAFN